MTEVISINAGFGKWYADLEDRAATDVGEAIALLEGRGVTLPFPYSSAIRNTRYPFRELRVQSGGEKIRIYYAFDGKRRAVLIVGGFKHDDDFYDYMTPRAEKLWETYDENDEVG